MTTRSFSAIILAAGKGTRFQSKTSKVLHPVGGLPLIEHLMKTLGRLKCRDVCLVTSPELTDVRETITRDYPHVVHGIQETPRGTAHAVLAAESFIKKMKGNLLVLYGDVPLIDGFTIQRIAVAARTADVVVLGMQPDDPGEYGRLFCDDEGQIDRIVENKDATEIEQRHTFCNSGIMMINGVVALSLLKAIENNNRQKEFYLTDIVAIARKKGFTTRAIEGDSSELYGVNTREDLAWVEHMFQNDRRQWAMHQGVTLLDPITVYLSYDTELASDVTIEPNVFFGPGVKVDSGAVIKANSYLEGVSVGPGAIVGPFARLRPGTVLEANTKVGNFVEIKKSHIGKGSKISHLSYIGDATLGAEVNVGAGTITCNYDGYEKHVTVINDGVFIGSNTALVAPVTLGKGVLVAAGSVITKDVPENALTVTRGDQLNLTNGGKRFRERHEEVSKKTSKTKDKPRK